MNNLNAELILHRLDEIAKKQDEFNKKVEVLGKQMINVRAIGSTLDDIKEWKDKVQEVVSTTELKEIKEWKKEMEEQMSPKQLTQHLKEHESFKTFKTQAMMIWAVVQALMTIMIFWDKIFK